MVTFGHFRKFRSKLIIFAITGPLWSWGWPDTCIPKTHFLCFDRSRICRTLRIWWTSHKWWTYFWTYFVRRYDGPEFSKFPKIPVFFWRVVLNFDYFRTGVSDLSFGNIFGKFRKIFGGPKPLVFLELFWPSKDQESQKTGKVERPKIFGQRSALVLILLVY